MFKYWIVISLCAVLISPAFAKRGASETQKLQATADQQFAAGNYKKARKSYKKLAKVGDKFSQHRLSMMYLQGLGVNKNLLDSYAWAYVAAEGDDPNLILVRDKIFALIPAANHSAARKEARALSSRYGDLAAAVALEKKIKRSMRGCTGSRIGSSCDKVVVGNLPRGGVQTQAEQGTGLSGLDGAAPARSVSGAATAHAGRIGYGSNAAHFMELQKSLQKLETFIEEHSGEVELHELEVKEES